MKALACVALATLLITLWGAYMGHMEDYSGATKVWCAMIGGCR